MAGTLTNIRLNDYDSIAHKHIRVVMTSEMTNSVYTFRTNVDLP